MKGHIPHDTNFHLSWGPSNCVGHIACVLPHLTSPMKGRGNNIQLHCIYITMITYKM